MVFNKQSTKYSTKSHKKIKKLKIFSKTWNILINFDFKRQLIKKQIIKLEYC